MKLRKYKWIGLLLILVVAATVSAFALDPGSASDPLVTKSYVDQKLAALQNGSAPGAAATFAPVSVSAGKKLIGGEGTELILRSGKAKAIDNGVNGISDLTVGADLKGGTAIGPNHLLLVPRADGRGISATTEIWVMVKGPYSIQ